MKTPRERRSILELVLREVIRRDLQAAAGFDADMLRNDTRPLPGSLDPFLDEEFSTEPKQ